MNLVARLNRNGRNYRNERERRPEKDRRIYATLVGIATACIVAAVLKDTTDSRKENAK